MTNVLTKIILLTFFTSTLTSLQATIYYVDALAANGGHGQGWNNAFNQIQDAIDASNSGDEIWVKNGIYYPPTSSNRSVSIVLKEGVMLYGGFAGTETLRSQRDEENTQTIISGDIGTPTDHTDNSYSIIFSINVSSSAGLDGFIIQHGMADNAGDEVEGNGAGWYNQGMTLAGSNPTIRNCHFLDNTATGLGAGIYNSGVGSPFIFNSTFESNEAAQGGAIFNGGQIAGDNSPTIDKCSFISNTATYGGAIFNSGNRGTTEPVIKNCLFSLNRAVGSGSIAGAIYNFAKTGGIASTTIINSIFVENSSDSSAGGVYTLASTNSTGKTDIINCVFYKNEAIGNNGGAVYLNESDGGDGEINIHNCIFKENTANFNNHLEMSSSSSSQSPTMNISYSLIDASNASSIMFLSANDVFNVLGGMVYNNSPEFVDAANNDFSIEDHSFAKEAGSNSLVPNTITEDYLGSNRIIGANVDMGAIENTSSVLPIDLLEFTARFRNENVVLNWITASEINNDHFSIQRSSDGVSFKTITTIDGAGNSDHALRYESLDKNPLPGTSYYRLKQTDYDEQFSYSPIEVVEIMTGNIKVYPNPVAGALYVSLSDFEAGEANFSISNITGKEVISGTTPINENISIIRLDEITSLLPGTYIIRVFTPNNGAFSTKFLKTRM